MASVETFWIGKPWQTHPCLCLASAKDVTSVLDVRLLAVLMTNGFAPLTELVPTGWLQSRHEERRVSRKAIWPKGTVAMFDRYLQPAVGRALRPVAYRLVRRGISADIVTFAGLLFGLGAVPLLITENYGLALFFILANRIFDGLDGAMARLSGQTHRGAFIDIAFDFFFYASIPFGFALADPQENAVAAAGLLLGFAGTASSFLSFAVIAERKGLTSKDFPDKGIYYLGGLAEGSETIAVMVAMCLWPAAFPALAWLFFCLCIATTITRWWWGWQAFSEAAVASYPAKAQPHICDSREITANGGRTSQSSQVET